MSKKMKQIILKYELEVTIDVEDDFDFSQDNIDELVDHITDECVAVNPADFVGVKDCSGSTGLAKVTFNEYEW